MSVLFISPRSQDLTGDMAHGKYSVRFLKVIKNGNGAHGSHPCHEVAANDSPWLLGSPPRGIVAQHGRPGCIAGPGFHQGNSCSSWASVQDATLLAVVTARKALSWHKVTTNWDVYTWKGGAEQSIPNSPAPKTSLSRVHVEMQSPVHCSKSLGTCLFNKLPKWFF